MRIHERNSANESREVDAKFCVCFSRSGALVFPSGDIRSRMNGNAGRIVASAVYLERECRRGEEQVS